MTHVVGLIEQTTGINSPSGGEAVANGRCVRQAGTQRMTKGGAERTSHRLPPLKQSEGAAILCCGCLWAYSFSRCSRRSRSRWTGSTRKAPACFRSG